ncbi:MAG: ribonucleoside triphosphate reductase [Candidatus Aenigmarchaeota archaeon]|nr:ribonucleoside triphosphate reductase [Candidatus Aenigmarchaeota archaeon]
MKCPYCASEESKVVDKRETGELVITRRRRECLKCGKRFTTYERVEAVDLAVVKKDGRREGYDRAKLQNSMTKALEKRPVEQSQIEKAVDEIESELRKAEKPEVTTRQIGELVMKKLKELDKVGYIRYASIYKEFTDVTSFEAELKKLATEKERLNVKPKLHYVVKRDGAVIKFDKSRIIDAIWKAAESVGGTDKEIAEQLADKVVEALEGRFNDKSPPQVEQIQDIVEKILIENGHAKTAKAYILYREQHAKIRETKSTFVDVENTINSYINQEDWRVKENSNEQYSFSGLLLYAAGKVMANYNLTQMYTPAIAEAHKKGYFHIHDLSHGVIGYCAGWSLKNLLVRGFGGVPNKVDCKPSKHLSTVVHQMVNYIGCLQMEFAGAQAFSSVDTFLAPFIKAEKLDYKAVKQNMQQLVFSLNIPSRWGSQYPFSNLTFDWTVPEDLKKEPAIVGGKHQDFTYGDCQKEIDMINKAFLEVMLEGDAYGRIFSFPIPTYNVTKDFDWESDNAQLLFELTAKYGTPYFQNYVGSDLDPGAVRAMCCRLNINQQELMNRPGNMWGPGDNTGSIGVVTMNLNRLGYEARTEDEFLEKLRQYMLLARDALEIKRKVVERNLQNGLMPYTRTYLGTFANHFSTIGLCGMNEACINLLEKDISTSEGKAFTIKTLNFMREMTRQFQMETGSLYNLEATPAESAAYRLARLDRQMYPDIITAGESEPYLTNSTQLPVGYTDDLVKALEHQNDIQPLYTGGTIFHTFLGERMLDGNAAKTLVKKIAHNTKLPYFSLTPTFSVCKTHGYIKGENPKCPTCGSETEVYSRIVGYYRPIKNWNAGKQEEFKDRLEFAEKKALEKPLKCAAS